MAVSYKKLWHLLIDKNMKKKDLQTAANLTSHAMRKLSHDEAVTTDTLAKICRTLDCKVDDIMEVIGVGIAGNLKVSQNKGEQEINQ